MNQHPTYEIPGSLLQGIVDVLQELPARVSRLLLNELVHVTAEQDARRSAAAQRDASADYQAVRDKVISDLTRDGFVGLNNLPREP